MKTTSLLIAALAGMALAAPAQEAAPASTPTPAKLADIEIEFYTEREYRGEVYSVKDLEDRECSTSSLDGETKLRIAR
jgi:hypothetical protein